VILRLLPNPLQVKIMGLKSYRELLVWKSSMDAAVLFHKYTESFPKEEIYGVTSQIRRAALSIPSNIAEGYGSNQTRVWLRHLAIAMGSSSEAETQLIFAQRIQYGDRDKAAEIYLLLQEVGRQIRNLRKSLRNRLNRKRKPDE